MNAIINKIDLFMKLHVIPRFNLEKIKWVFSISGGKDSYAMCDGVYTWYEMQGKKLNAIGIYIWQWGNENPQEYLEKSLPWLRNIRIIDAKGFTDSLLNGEKTQQAPCRSCSDIRRYFSDAFLKQINTDCPVLLCRGLHMTDMVISILWRLVWYGIGERLDGKGFPLINIYPDTYLAKPLCYVREYECQMYSIENNYTPFFCECPAHLYPSRRDIIEESVRQFYTSPLWEFDVPGSEYYLYNTTKIEDIQHLRAISLSGIETKKNTIPSAYYEFAKNYFLKKDITIAPNVSDMLLENYCDNYLMHGLYGNPSKRECGCKLFECPNQLSKFDLKMIGTLGPFWASMALPPQQRRYYKHLQEDIWGFSIDVYWSQVYSLMKLYNNYCLS